MLVALDGRPEWLACAAGAYYAADPHLGRYTIPNRLHDAVAYGVPIVVVTVGWVVREFAARRGDGRGGDFRIRRAGHGHGARGGRGASVGAGGSRRGPGLSRLAGIGAFLPVGY